jgi:hypothetical protein
MSEPAQEAKSKTRQTPSCFGIECSKQREGDGKVIIYIGDMERVKL